MEQTKLTKAELLEILRNPSSDWERRHVDADNALLDYIDDDEIREAFESIDKWYA